MKQTFRTKLLGKFEELGDKLKPYSPAEAISCYNYADDIHYKHFTDETLYKTWLRYNFRLEDLSGERLDF